MSTPAISCVNVHSCNFSPPLRRSDDGQQIDRVCTGVYLACCRGGRRSRMTADCVTRRWIAEKLMTRSGIRSPLSPRRRGVAGTLRNVRLGRAPYSRDVDVARIKRRTTKTNANDVEVRRRVTASRGPVLIHTDAGARFSCRGVVLKKKWGTPETRLRQRFSKQFRPTYTYTHTRQKNCHSGSLVLSCDTATRLWVSVADRY